MGGSRHELVERAVRFGRPERVPTVFLILLLFVLSHKAQAAVDSEPQQSLELRGQRIMVRAVIEKDRLREDYFGRRDNGWIKVASSGQAPGIGPVSLILAQNAPLAVTARNLRLSDGSLIEEFDAGPHRVVRRLTLIGVGPWIRVTTRLEPAGRLDLCQFSDRLNFVQKADWSYSPSVGGFNPDAQYKAPLILVQAGNVALGIVPAVDTLGREELKRCNHGLDLDVPGGPMLGVGFMPARLASHSVYVLDTNRVWTTETAVENNYFLLVTASAEPAQAYREAVRFYWERFGRAEQAHAADQQVGTDARYRSLALWDEWRARVWEKESAQGWIQVPLPDGSVGGGVCTRRWGPGPSVYLSSWFNTLRTSYGMALYARRTGREDLLKLAGQTLELALKAPGRDGAFKCIAVPGTNGRPTLWAAGDGSGGSTKDGFLGYDMCWTAYWMLKWHAAFTPPEKYRSDFGRFRSPLVFADGRPVRTAADWQRRRAEILGTWHKLMGPWPPLIERPRVELVSTSRRESITQQEVRLEIALGGEMVEALLLVPEGEARNRPAVLVVYYDAETGVGLGAPLRDYAWQLAKRGFVTLSIGKPNAHIDLTTTNKPRTEPYLGPVGQPVWVQPLSALAYAAANAHTVLAQRPEVDPARIGIVGHSFGGKWAMFASFLYDKFACAVWSDPGIVFDERGRRQQNPSGSVNYWDVWYLGFEPGAIADPKDAGTWRKLPSEGQPRTGAYKALVEGGHDLVELHALMAPRPFLVSGGTADLPERWPALNHAIAVNKLLGFDHRVALTTREGHTPTAEANEQVYRFFEWCLRPPD